MNLLNIEKMSKSYSHKTLFNEASLSIHAGDKIGLIGINGTGKSTLLKVIIGDESLDSGNLTKGIDIRIAYLPQTPDFDNDLSIIDNVLLEQKADKDYINLEGRAISMLHKLGIIQVDISPKHLSGGEKKRIALVKTLLTPAEILVLDEPTNHLDHEMTTWLESYLNKYLGAFIMVTHDRYFLDNVVNKIIEIDKGSLYSYKANFSKFLELKSTREESLIASERKANALYKKELEWIMRGPRARSTKQKAQIKRFEELRDREKITEDEKVQMDSTSSRLGKKTIELQNISKSFEEKTLIKDFSYIFLRDDKIGIIGPNGCGKSTLLNIIMGLSIPNSGDVEIGSTIKIGYFTQQNEPIDDSLKVIDYIKETAEYIETLDGIITASQMCENFLFDSYMQYTYINRLSGGERRRLYLLKILMEAPNVLILDEPTNDLDIQTLSILEEYLSKFAGIIITVSHDRYFLDKVVNRIFAFEDNGQIKQYEGNFSDYIESHDAPSLNITSSTTNTKSSKRVNTWRNKDNKLKFTYSEQKEFNTIDDDIAYLETKLEELEAFTIKHATDYSKLNEILAEKELVEKDLEYKMERWLYLNDLNEKIIQNQ